MTDSIDMVREFALATEKDRSPTSTIIPHVPENEWIVLWLQMITEELSEYTAGLLARDHAEMLDGLCDMQYLIDYAFVCCGMVHLKGPAMIEVHRTNMNKIEPSGRTIRDMTGRVIKPRDWQPPRMAELLEIFEKSRALGGRALDLSIPDESAARGENNG